MHIANPYGEAPVKAWQREARANAERRSTLNQRVTARPPALSAKDAAAALAPQLRTVVDAVCLQVATSDFPAYGRVMQLLSAKFDLEARGAQTAIGRMIIAWERSNALVLQRSATSGPLDLLAGLVRLSCEEALADGTGPVGAFAAIANGQHFYNLHPSEESVSRAVVLWEVSAGHNLRQSGRRDETLRQRAHRERVKRQYSIIAGNAAFRQAEANRVWVPVSVLG